MQTTVEAARELNEKTETAANRVFGESALGFSSSPASKGERKQSLQGFAIAAETRMTPLGLRAAHSVKGDSYLMLVRGTKGAAPLNVGNVTLLQELRRSADSSQNTEDPETSRAYTTTSGLAQKRLQLSLVWRRLLAWLSVERAPQALHSQTSDDQSASHACKNRVERISRAGRIQGFTAGGLMKQLTSSCKANHALKLTTVSVLPFANPAATVGVGKG